MENLNLSQINIISQIYTNPGRAEVYIGQRIDPRSPQDLICFKKIFVGSVNEANKKNQECLNMIKLRHDNIVNIISSSLEGRDGTISSILIFMEYCADKDLDKLIKVRAARNQAWTQDELMTYLDQLISGFVFLQNNTVAHRDIKPANIFVANNFRTLKIGDFGCCRMANMESYSINGTELYLSPKVREAQSESNHMSCTVKHNLYKSDVYSLGLVLLYMTTLQLKQELTHLNGLQNTINKEIFKISDDYSKIKLLLSHMLQVEETNRPDFLELKEIFQEIRQRGLGSSMLNCDSCGELRNRTLTKVIDRECFCNECTSKVVLYPDCEL